MLVLRLTKEELVKIIKEISVLNSGYNGSLFLYNNYLIKIDKTLFDDIKKMNETKAILRIENYLSSTHFADYSQIDYLCQRQKDIKLTEFDLGVVVISDVVVGTILPNHLDYENLAKFKIKNKKDMFQILKILYNLLAVIKELELNDINVLDLMNNLENMNVLYKETDIKLCDLEGVFVTYNIKSQKIVMYLEYLKILKEMLKRMKKINPRIIILEKKLKFNEKSPYESLWEFLNLLERFLIEDVKIFGFSKNDIAFSKSDLFSTKKAFCDNLKIKKEDIEQGLILPSEAIYGDLTIVGNRVLENISLPKYIYGNLNIIGFKTIRNVEMPLNIEGEKEIKNVLELDNVTFSPNYSIKYSFNGVKVLKNIVFPSNSAIGFDFMTLKEIENVVLPQEIYYFYVPMVSSLKGMVLPKKVLDCMIIKDLEVLDGAIVLNDTENYQIVTSFGRFNLYDILSKSSKEDDEKRKCLTIKNKYDITRLP